PAQAAEHSGDQVEDIDGEREVQRYHAGVMGAGEQIVVADDESDHRQREQESASRQHDDRASALAGEPARVGEGGGHDQVEGVTDVGEMQSDAIEISPVPDEPSGLV